MDEYRVFLFSGQNVPNDQLYDSKWFSKDYSQYFQDEFLQEQYLAVKSDFAEAKATYEQAIEANNLAKEEFVHAYESAQNTPNPDDTSTQFFQKFRNALTGKGFNDDETLQEKMYEDVRLEVGLQSKIEEDGAPVDTLVDLPIVEVEEDLSELSTSALADEQFNLLQGYEDDGEFPAITLSEGIPAVGQYQIASDSPFSVSETLPDDTYEIVNRGSHDSDNPAVADTAFSI